MTNFERYSKWLQEQRKKQKYAYLQAYCMFPATALVSAGLGIGTILFLQEMEHGLFWPAIIGIIVGMSWFWMGSMMIVGWLRDKISDIKSEQYNGC